jgi:hypothetical protein
VSWLLLAKGNEHSHLENVIGESLMLVSDVLYRRTDTSVVFNVVRGDPSVTSFQREKPKV